MSRPHGVRPAAVVQGRPEAAREQHEQRGLCLICEDQPRQVRFVCGHANCCESCARLVKLRDNLCPTCRSPLGDAPGVPIGGVATTYVK